MIIDLNKKDTNYTLGQLIFDIGSLVMKYEESQVSNSKPSRLLKTKEVLIEYPMLTQYGLEQAVRENKLPIVKRGKLNFFDSNDIELYIQNQKQFSNENKTDDNSSSKIKYV